MKDYLGAHMSIAGGIYNALERGVEAGCGVVQVFTQNSTQWHGKPIPDSDILLFKEKLAESGINEVVTHDIYLINLAASPGEMRDKSIVAFQEEMVRCSHLGIEKIVMHPGSHGGDGEETGLKRITEAFDQLLSTTTEYKGKILLETTAGQGTNLGYSFEHLRTIIEGSKHHDRFGVCYDTCHTFAAGYDIRTESSYHEVWDNFERIIGLDHLHCFHFNDSKKGLNSHVDRHEHIGKGELGANAFSLLMNDPRFVNIPKILETPKGDNNEMDEINLKLLRNMVKKR